MRYIEILYVTSEKLMFSVDGEGKASAEPGAEIICEEKCISCSKSVMLCCNTSYKITLVNLSGDEMRVFVNGEKANLSYLMGERKMEVGEVVFETAGINTIEIFCGGKIYITIRAEVCPNIAEYKEHFRDIISRVGEITQGEVFNFLCENCLKYGIKTAGYKNIYELFNGICEDFCVLLKRAVRKRKYAYKLEKIITVGRRRVLKNKSANYKKINIYDTEENRKIKYTAQILGEFIKSFAPFCGELTALAEKLERTVSESEISEVEALDGVCKNKEIAKIYDLSETVKLSGSFVESDSKDIEDMYKFFCYVKMNKILSDLYLTVENQIFETDGAVFCADIYKKRSAKFVNTENDNQVTLTYNPEKKPEIYVKINKKDKDLSYGRVYGFNVVYRDDAGENENNLAYALKSKIRGTKSRLPVLCGAYVLCIAAAEGEFENLIPMSPYDSRSFEEWIKNTAGDKDLNDYPSFEEIISEEICKEDFEKYDVMTAVVKTKSQFNLNIKEKFYYIPSHFIEENKDIRYVALYQSKTLFGKDAGIRYFGEVESMKAVARHKISEIPKNSDEMYYRFDIKSWQTLDNVIKPKDFAEVCMFTNMFLLKNAKELPELYAGSFTEYVLKAALSGSDEINFRIFNTYFKCDRENVTVYLKNGETVKFGRGTENLRFIAQEIDKMLC